ncbi:MAG: hypothetical protein WCA04_11210 [Geobacteraceae bacterium]
MNMSLRRQLSVFLLLVAVLLVPIKSFAHDAASGALKDACACQLLLADCCEDERGGQPDHYPDKSTNDCCDSDNGCPDTADSPILCDVKVNFSVRQLFDSTTNSSPPKVFLAIFVPPEN